MDFYSYFCQKVVVFWLFVFNTDTQAVTSGEYSNISEIRPNRFGGTLQNLS